MSEPAAADRPPRGFGFARVVLLVLGILAILVGLGLVSAGVAGLWVDQTRRDDDGYLTTRSEPFATDDYAILSDSLDLDTEGPDEFFSRHVLGKVQIHVAGTGGKDVFVGIGPARAVDAYLEGVGHSALSDFEFDPFHAEYNHVDGGAPATPPAEARFWAASAQGSGRQTVTWKVRGGSWSAVLMNADGSQHVAARVAVGAEADSLVWLAIALLILGALVLAAGGLLLYLALRGRGTAVAPAAPAAVATLGPDVPVGLRGELDPGTSRALWLVKWLLLLPHFVILVFLWLAFFVLTVVAGFAILFTARYPRAIFDFNVGVLRWTWRVMFYGYWALGTDRYPPFSLGPEPGYPAGLDVAYPDQPLSRGLVLVKWWLLALPQYVLLGIFVGGWSWGWHDQGWFWWGSGGLVEVLAVFAAVALLFTARYPRGIFHFVLGLDRWVFRVIAYAALMTDRYPPFRLDQGPVEPVGSDAEPPV